MRNMQLFGQSKKKKKGQKYLRFRYLIQMITKTYYLQMGCYYPTDWRDTLSYYIFCDPVELI